MSRRVFVLLGSLVVTALLLVLVFSLGSWAYKHRRWSFHHGRLERMLGLQPTAEQVKAGLEGEGARWLGRADSPAGLDAIAARWAPAVREQVVAMGERAGEAQAFEVGEMVYFVFFDATGKMMDFLVVEREP